MGNFKPVGTTIATVAGATIGGGAEIIRQKRSGVEELDKGKIATRAAAGAVILGGTAVATQNIKVGTEGISLWDAGKSAVYGVVGKDFVPDGAQALKALQKTASEAALGADLQMVFPDKLINDLLTQARAGEDIGPTIADLLTQHFGHEGARTFGDMVKNTISEGANYSAESSLLTTLPDMLRQNIKAFAEITLRP